jgi:lipopolysaccharide transport system ATP-binding protein
MSYNEVAIRVHNLSKCYHIYDRPQDRLKQSIIPRFQRLIKRRPTGYYREFWALKDVSFEVRKGETVGIIGRNGAGKSTLLQIVCGTITPTAGFAQTKGRVAALLELGAGFNSEFTGRENVFLNGALLGLTHESIEDSFDKIAAFAEIGDFIDQPVKTYSTGMYVRLAFAVQACLEPEILVVDEALAVGDEKFQRKCYSHIDSLRQNGTAILLVTHGAATIQKFCQRAILIEKGAVHGIGSSKQIVDQYHALLYSDEQAYLRFMNEEIRNKDSQQTDVVAPGVHGSPATNGDRDLCRTKVRAIISDWKLLDANGVGCDLFQSGDEVSIRAEIRVFDHIEEVQAGMLIRTVEGVPVFGTSTLYHDKNVRGALPGQKLLAEFTLAIALCEGPYFVSIAIAEAVSASEMVYLDKKTDVLILHVREHPAKGSGIASLPVAISFESISGMG